MASSQTEKHDNLESLEFQQENSIEGGGQKTREKFENKKIHESLADKTALFSSAEMDKTIVPNQNNIDTGASVVGDSNQITMPNSP